MLSIFGSVCGSPLCENNKGGDGKGGLFVTEKGGKTMRKVARFYDDSDKAAHNKINEWLKQNPSVTLVDIKPIVTGSRSTVIYAILDVPDVPYAPEKHSNNQENPKEEK